MVLLFVISELKLTFWPFLWIFFFYNIAIAYVDSLAEGISAIITKDMEKIKKINALKGEHSSGDDSMKAFGSYNAIRSLFQAIAGLAGALVAEYTALKYSALILAFYPLVLFVYVILFFKEKNVRIFDFLIFIITIFRVMCSFLEVLISKKAFTSH